jgi:hypothetical protein
VKTLLLSLLLTSISLAQLPPLHTGEQYEQVIEALTDPAKLDTIKGARAATPRLRRIMHWLRLAQRDGFDPAAVIDQGQKDNRSAGLSGPSSSRNP